MEHATSYTSDWNHESDRFMYISIQVVINKLIDDVRWHTRYVQPTDILGTFDIIIYI